ncbi:MAG: ATP synthase F1 subunit epsilon [Candidatus Dadabacteria bacterium]|nr:MAG: ATP synthase F1 subunit epsilon [Candidatus Dadabacteria bacterium]
MADKLFLRIVTPRGLVLEKEVEQLVLPTTAGEVGVLPHHAPYLTTLGAGILECLCDNEKIRLVVSEGFCLVNLDRVTLLCDKVFKRDEINLAEYTKKKDSLKKTLESSPTFQIEWLNAKKELDLVEALEKLVSH